MKNFIKLTTLEILALAQFDPQTLPPLVCSAMGKLMKNYGEQVDEQNFVESLTAKGES